MNNPVRLYPKEEPASSTIMDKIEEWLLCHTTLVFIVLFALLIALFVCLIFALTGVSAVESGAMRNFINGGMV